MSQSYNLILFHHPNAQHISDFETLRNMMAWAAQDIDVHIVSAGALPESDFWRQVAQRPTLIFSPTGVEFAADVRGTRIISNPLSKIKEAELLHKAGFDIPMTTLITPKTILDERQWGPYVVLKPNQGSLGRGINLTRSRDVHWVDPNSWPENDYRRGRKLLAQQFVDTGPHISSYRVFTVLGEVVYALISTSKLPIALPDSNTSEPVAMDIAANGVERELQLIYDEEIISLGRRIHRKFPELPVMGIDIVRHKESGQLFVMEFNSHGWIWHLSSPHGLKYQRSHHLDLYGQFNALKVIATALIETTRRMAS